MGAFPSYSGLLLDGGGSVLSTAGALAGLNDTAPAATAWPSANLAIFVPIRVPKLCIAYKMIVGAGVTAAGNFDAGIYDENGNRLVSIGATAKGSSVEHVLNITDTVLGPGRYYLAMSADGTNNYIMLASTTQKSRLMGTLQMATAYTLPAAATMVARTGAPIPMIAALTRSL